MRNPWERRINVIAGMIIGAFLVAFILMLTPLPPHQLWMAIVFIFGLAGLIGIIWAVVMSSRQALRERRP